MSSENEIKLSSQLPIDTGTETREGENRCWKCNKLFHVIRILVSLPPEFLALIYPAKSITDIYPDLGVKVCVETKCRNCKEMNNKIIIV